MGLKFRRQIGPKGLKLNIGNKGIKSTSFKIAKGITYNSKRGLRLGLHGTGISYNFGKKKTKDHQHEINNIQSESKLKQEYKKYDKYDGGYNRKAISAVIISLILCVTPLWPLGLLSIPSLIWLLVNTMIRMKKYNKRLKEKNTTPLYK